MPAYFTVAFSLREDPTAPDSVAQFYQALEQCGLRFLRGYWHAEADTLKEIVKWNAAKLRDHYVPGMQDEYQQHYKQALYRFGDFSEARVYLLNHALTDEFAFHLIIPEDDFFGSDKGSSPKRRRDRMEQIETLLIRMWNSSELLSIQTGWECSDMPVSASALERGCRPLTEPFAIVPARLVKEKWRCERRKIGREGVLLIDENNWNASL